jgi:poly [ADP-ribose] polymerase
VDPQTLATLTNSIQGTAGPTHRNYKL